MYADNIYDGTGREPNGTARRRAGVRFWRHPQVRAKPRLVWASCPWREGVDGHAPPAGTSPGLGRAEMLSLPVSRRHGAFAVTPAFGFRYVKNERHGGIRPEPNGTARDRRGRHCPIRFCLHLSWSSLEYWLRAVGCWIFSFPRGRGSGASTLTAHDHEFARKRGLMRG
jgi:hypothetical protein